LATRAFFRSQRGRRRVRLIVACLVTASFAVACGGSSNAKPAGPHESISDLKELGLAQAGVLRRDDLPGSWVNAVGNDTGSRAAAASFHAVFDSIGSCLDATRRAQLRKARTSTFASDDLVSGSDRKIAVARSHVFADVPKASEAFDVLSGPCAADRITKELRKRIDAAPGVNGVTAEHLATTAPKIGDAAAGYEVKLTIQTQEAPAPVAFQVGVVRAGRVVGVIMLGAVADPFDTVTRDAALSAIAGRVAAYR